ncbi:MAG: hypothetical protein QNJ89_10015 [Acidimicrobiia bacterium]|nr:hypothetical protein [Acidimicrobiia bacterium]
MLTNKPTTYARFLFLAALLCLFATACGNPSGETRAQASGSEETATSAPASTLPAPEATTTTEAPSAAVEALLEQYYEAYNAGDAETALGLRSDFIPVVPAPNLRFWVETLNEQVSADCVPHPEMPAVVRCVETYTDSLHGPAGATGGAIYQYAERNGELIQSLDSSMFMLPGCRAGRCPGDIVSVPGREPVWDYELIEEELLAWLQQNYPEAVADIEDSGRLHYLASNSDHVAAVLPYVEEFVASSPDWGTQVAAADEEPSRTLLEEVVAGYEAWSSHDPEVYEDFFGEPPGDVDEWWWEQGRRVTVSCVETESPDEVRCEGFITDDFYTRAGAVFEFRELWNRVGSDNLSVIEWANSSGWWAYSDFEKDFAHWMREAYPEDAAIAFPTVDLVHNGEAAAIAVSHLDEFLEASDEYPRDPDGKNDWRG